MARSGPSTLVRDALVIDGSARITVRDVAAPSPSGATHAAPSAPPVPPAGVSARGVVPRYRVGVTLALPWILGVGLGALLLACGSGGASPARDGGGGVDASVEGGPDDGAAGPDAPDGADGADGADGGTLADAPPGDGYGHVVCSGPLPDAGFSSLADLPIARLCGGAYGDLYESSPPPCQGLVLVTVATGVDTGDYWLFDATTGALVATGEGVDGTISCAGAVPGFQFPDPCFDNGGWDGPGIDLCDDAAADAAAGDAATDAIPSD